jgi:hypothetical protein
MPTDDRTWPLALHAVWLDWTRALLQRNQYPLSGNVDQWIRTWGESVGQFGLFNINIEGTRKPQLEKRISSSYSYGRQLGRMLDVLSPLVDHNKQLMDKQALDDFHQMVEDIASIKRASVAAVVAEVKAWQSSPGFEADLAELLRQLTALSKAARRNQ